MKKLFGFTLIEVMIVVAIIGILASVLVPAFTGAEISVGNGGNGGCTTVEVEGVSVERCQ